MSIIKEETARIHKSLVYCIIGAISMHDLYYIRTNLVPDGDPLENELYKKSLDDHCSMAMYASTDIQ